jgi:hypothetical protein
VNLNLAWQITSQIHQEVKMRKAVTNLEIVYEQVEVSPEESQQRLNDMFDILFEETLQYLKEKKVLKKDKDSKFDDQTQKGGEQYERRYAN